MSLVSILKQPAEKVHYSYNSSHYHKWAGEQGRPANLTLKLSDKLDGLHTVNKSHNQPVKCLYIWHLQYYWRLAATGDFTAQKI